MMFFPPFYRYSYNYPHLRNYPKNYNMKSQGIDETPAEPIKNESDENKKESRTNDDSPMFEIFGISLYFDDVLIICLLLFLFQEGVDDQWLYIALILLLMS